MNQKKLFRQKNGDHLNRDEENDWSYEGLVLIDDTNTQDTRQNNYTEVYLGSYNQTEKNFASIDSDISYYKKSNDTLLAGILLNSQFRPKEKSFMGNNTSNSTLAGDDYSKDKNKKTEWHR